VDAALPQKGRGTGCGGSLHPETEQYPNQYNVLVTSALQVAEQATQQHVVQVLVDGTVACEGDHTAPSAGGAFGGRPQSVWDGSVTWKAGETR